MGKSWHWNTSTFYFIDFSHVFYVLWEKNSPHGRTHCSLRIWPSTSLIKVHASPGASSPGTIRKAAQQYSFTCLSLNLLFDSRHVVLESGFLTHCLTCRACTGVSYKGSFSSSLLFQKFSYHHSWTKTSLRNLVFLPSKRSCNQLSLLRLTEEKDPEGTIPIPETILNNLRDVKTHTNNRLQIPGESVMLTFLCNRQGL